MEFETGADNLEKRLKSAVTLLSNVTNQPVSNFKIAPKRFNGKLTDNLAFRANISFGQEYRTNFWHILKRDNEGLRDYGAEDCGYVLRDENNNVLSETRYGSSESYDKEEILEDKNIIDRARLRFLLKQIGGIYVEHPAFMDYETYTTESLKDEHSYFKSLYLAIMCSLKEKGVKLPPILSKKEHIREAMYKGDLETLDSILSEELGRIETEYEKGMFKHAQFEAGEIRKYATIRRQYHDPSIPLIEKMSDWHPITIPGNNTARKYNVLVVEDFGKWDEDPAGTISKLSTKVAEELKRIGKYGGSNVFSTVNLGQCMEICGTGQIDAILMDGGHYALQGMSELMSSLGGGLRMKQNYEETDIPELDGFGEKKIWKDRIFKVIEANDHNPPGCLIVPGDIMNMAVGKFIDEILTSRDKK